jgi:G3E family GTPase
LWGVAICNAIAYDYCVRLAINNKRWLKRDPFVESLLEMPWKRGERIPTNLIVGFLGSGKTTAITNLIEQRPDNEHWSIFVNEFGTVSIDHALVESNTKEVAVEKLGGGCACCTMSFAFKPLLAQFIRRSKPDRLILEPSGISHPAKVVDILRSDDFSGAIDLRNIICLIDPNEFDDARWQKSEVFQDQVQLADIVVLNWTDVREREQIERCREWVASFNPAKKVIVETKFGVIDSELLDLEFMTTRFPLFAEAHPTPSDRMAILAGGTGGLNAGASATQDISLDRKPEPRHPLCFPNQGTDFLGCGWIFHIDDVFDRNNLFDLLGAIRGVVRLKGVFRCQNDWWTINRTKQTTDFSKSTYRRDSRLEIIFESDLLNWDYLEESLVECIKK